MARIVRFYETGGPEVLKIEDYSPGEPKPGEMKVRIEAIGLNRAETMFRSGAYLESPKLPASIGYEASAVVLALGAGVDGFSVGEPVSVIPAFSMNSYSVYADETIVPAYAVVKRPAGLSAVEAAAVWMAYLTAYGALVDIAHMTKGDFVLIPAASSSVGLTAIQMANAAGAIPIAATRTQAKAAALSRAGAAHVIVTDEQDLAAEVARITDGAGARVIFDPAGGPMIEKLAEAASRFGIIFQYGALSRDPTPFPLFAALQKGLTFRGYTLFEFITDKDRLAKAVDYIAGGLTSGAFVPVVARTFTLDQIVEAHRFMESNEHLGKIVVTV